MKNKRIRYYVEGKDDQIVVDTLKAELNLIKSGKVQVFNVVSEEITDLRLRDFSPNTTVVLVFDTDVDSPEILNKNIQKLRRCKAVSEVVTIPQVSKLEDELVRSCDIRNIKELLNSQSIEHFKRDILHVTNLGAKLREHKFDINLFWSATPKNQYKNIPNQADQIKIVAR